VLQAARKVQGLIQSALASAAEVSWELPLQPLSP